MTQSVGGRPSRTDSRALLCKAEFSARTYRATPTVYLYYDLDTKRYISQTWEGPETKTMEIDSDEANYVKEMFLAQIRKYL